MSSRQNQRTSLRTRAVRYSPERKLARTLMKSLKLFGLALGASLALSSAAFADDLTVAAAGPMTGGASACCRTAALAGAEKIGSSKIPFVAGHYCSSSSIPASEAYADANVLQITPASTNPLFTERKLGKGARD